MTAKIDLYVLHLKKNNISVTKEEILNILENEPYCFFYFRRTTSLLMFYRPEVETLFVYSLVKHNPTEDYAKEVKEFLNRFKVTTIKYMYNKKGSETTLTSTKVLWAINTVML